MTAPPTVWPQLAGLCPCSYLVERIKDGRHYALKRTLITELSEAEKCVQGCS